MKFHSLLFILLFKMNISAQSFTKVISGPFVNSIGDSRSVNWVDVNNDGYQDCMITNGPAGGQNNALYINNTNGSFSLVTNDSLILDNKPSDGATWADADNDGDEDCFVVNWYGVNNLFYLNNGSGSFTKINSGILVIDGGYSETAAWGDYDNDGLVDLYVTNSGGTLQNFLYKNMGVNGFSKITGGDIVTDTQASRGVNWTDIDLDGDLDVFVTNEANANETIYRNDGSGVFTKLTTGPLLNDGKNTMSGSWGDYDNDGDLDVFLANNLAANALFRNDGSFNFTKITADTVSKGSARSFSSSWSDVDNDGDLDLFVTNAFGPPVKHTCLFYLNNGNGSFTRVNNNAVIADSAWTYGCAFGDYDNDGFEDLAVATCRFAGADQPDLLYHNNGNSNKWITIKLKGVVSNRSAIGAKIRVKAIINGNPVWQMREISAQSAYCSQNDIRAHFGIGNATKIDSVKIEWPSGILQYSLDLNANQFLTIVEDALPTNINRRNADGTTVRIFPNPASSQLILENETGFIVGDKISIYGIQGKLMAQLDVDEATTIFTIDLRKCNLPTGNYIVKSILRSGVVSQKIMITK